MKKRLMALLLTLAMVVTYMPALTLTSFAGEEPEAEIVNEIATLGEKTPEPVKEVVETPVQKAPMMLAEPLAKPEIKKHDFELSVAFNGKVTFDALKDAVEDQVPAGKNIDKIVLKAGGPAGATITFTNGTAESLSAGKYDYTVIDHHRSSGKDETVLEGKVEVKLYVNLSVSPADKVEVYQGKDKVGKVNVKYNDKKELEAEPKDLKFKVTDAENVDSVMVNDQVAEKTGEIDKNFDYVLNKDKTKTALNNMKNNTLNVVVTYKNEKHSIKTEVKDNKGGNVVIVKPEGEKKEAAAGEEVVFKTVADSGYARDSVKVTKTSGEAVNVYNMNKDTFSFEMPDEDVTISVDFDKVYNIESYNSNKGKVTAQNTSIHDKKVYLKVEPTRGYKLVEGSIKVEKTSGFSKTVEVKSDEHGYFFVMPKSNVKITAEFEAKVVKHAIKTEVKDKNSGKVVIVAPKGEKKEAKAGDKVVFRTKEYTGYALDSVKVTYWDRGIKEVRDLRYNRRSDTFSFTMPNADVKVSVDFDKLYNIKSFISEEGKVTAKKNSVHDEKVYLDVDPVAGYRLVKRSIKVVEERSWGEPRFVKVEKDRHGYYFVMPRNNVKITAKFESKVNTPIVDSSEAQGLVEVNALKNNANEMLYAIVDGKDSGVDFSNRELRNIRRAYNNDEVTEMQVVMTVSVKDAKSTDAIKKAIKSNEEEVASKDISVTMTVEANGRVIAEGNVSEFKSPVKFELVAGKALNGNVRVLHDHEGTPVYEDEVVSVNKTTGNVEVRLNELSTVTVVDEKPVTPVKTGDAENMGLWMMLAIAAMVAAGYAVSRKEN